MRALFIGCSDVASRGDAAAAPSFELWKIPMMAADRAFEVFVDDDRYSVPTLKLLSAIDEAEAREIAEGLLRASSHHLGVELCRGGRRLLGLGSYAAGVRNRTMRATDRRGALKSF